MNKYLISIIVISIAMGLCEIITPKYNGIDKYFKFISMLIILAVIISPIAKAIEELDNDFFEHLKEEISNIDKNESDYDKILNDYLLKYSVDEAKQYIKDMLNETFGISNDECEIKIYTNDQGNKMTVSKIQILLKGNAVFNNPYKIEEQISELYNASCEVLIKNKKE